MNYYDARQRESTKRWDFTCRNDGRIWPVGYCAGWREVEDYGDTGGAIPGLADEIESLRPFKDRYHQDGHDTPEEARECYRRYLLDHRLHLDRQHSHAEKCLVCGVWTDKSAVVDHGQHYPLCDEHRTRDEVERRFPAVHQIMSSY